MTVRRFFRTVVADRNRQADKFPEKKAGPFGFPENLDCRLKKKLESARTGSV